MIDSSIGLLEMNAREARTLGYLLLGLTAE